MMRAEEVEKEVREKKESAKGCHTSLMSRFQQLDEDEKERLRLQIRKVHKKALAKIQNMNGECSKGNSENGDTKK
jgi:hypothetical protein